MLANPFRRKAKSSDSQRSQSTSNGRPAITIATAEQSSKSKAKPKATDYGAKGAGKQEPKMVLPESSYRTSLIMPHLTRRFTLLQRPDGTMVTPDAMRQHLRAQRQRATEEGQPGANFLTEQEEDEIIDQMRRQTRLEATSNKTSRLRTYQGGGTDGFGGGVEAGRSAPARSSSPMSSPSSEATDRLSSLAATLGDLNASSSSTSMVPSSSYSSLFSGRSSERDHAYLRSLDKPRAGQMIGRALEPGIQEESEVDTIEENADGQVIEDGQGKKLDPAQDVGTDAVEQEEEEEEEEEETMPGGFASAARISRLSAQLLPSAMESDAEEQKATQPKLLQTNDVSEDFETRSNIAASPPNNTLCAPPSPTISPLLTTLSPEAFRRVSTALEEVINMVSPPSRVRSFANGEEPSSSYEFTAGSLETTDDDEERSIDHEQRDNRQSQFRLTSHNNEDRSAEDVEEVPFSSSDGPDVASFHARTFSNATDGTDASSRAHDADDEEDEGQDLGGSSRAPLAPRLHKLSSKGNRRGTPDSDATSFRSAKEEAAASSLSPALGSEEPDRPTMSEGLTDLSGSYQQQKQLGMLYTDRSQSPDRMVFEQRDVPPPSATKTITPFSGADDTDDVETPRILQQTTPTLDRGEASFQTPVQKSTNRRVSPLEYRSPVTPRGLREAYASFEPVSTTTTRPTSPLVDSSASHFVRARPASSRSKELSDDRRPLSPGGSTLQHSVLSADAIAARSQQRYFPRTPSISTRGETPDRYASGFRKTPANNGATEPNTVIGGFASAPATSSALAKVTDNTNEAAKGAFPRPSADGSGVNTASDLVLSPSKPAPPEIERLSTDGNGSEAPLSFYGTRVEQSDGEDTDGGDVWAKVARNLEAEEINGEEVTSDPSRHGTARENGNAGHPPRKHDLRPMSHFNAQDLENEGGMTMDQLTLLQANLVRTASQRQTAAAFTAASAIPPIPHRHSSSASSVANDTSAQPSVDQSLAASTEARVLGDSPTLLQPMASKPSQHSTDVLSGQVAESQEARRPFTPEMSSPTQAATTSFFDDAPRTNAHIAYPQASPASQMTKSSSIRSFRSQVMYDVTTSHRPTSPPLYRMSTQGSHRRNNSSLSNLPTLRDLSMRLNGSSSGRESSGGYHRSIPAPTDEGGAGPSSSPIPERHPGEGEGEAQAEVQKIPLAPEDAEEESSVARPYTPDGLEGHTVGNPTDSARQGDEVYDADASVPYSPDQSLTSGVVDQRHRQHTLELPAEAQGLSPASVQSAWTVHSGSGGSQRKISGDLMQDVASQARAATQALKGPHSGDGGPYIPPRKSKTLSKKKSRKNPGKVISPPQLLSTTQRLHNAQPITSPFQVAKSALGSGATHGKGSQMQPPAMRREVSDYSKNPKTMPATLIEPQQQAPSLLETNEMITGSSTGRYGSAASLPSTPVPHAGRRLQSDSVTSTPSKDRPREAGSFGRLMSKMRSKKGPSNVKVMSGQQPSVDLFPAYAEYADTDRAASPHLTSPTLERIAPHSSRGQSPFTIPGHAMAPGPILSRSASFNPESGPQVATVRESNLSPLAPPTMSRQLSSDSGAISPGKRPSSNLTGNGNHTSPDSSHRSLSPARERKYAMVATSPLATKPDSPVGSPVVISDGRFGDVTSSSVLYGSERDETGTPTPLAPLGMTGETFGSAMTQSDSMRTINDKTGRTWDEIPGDKTLPTTPMSPNFPPISKHTKRKSARDTVLRRTLIFPGDATFVEEKRKSMASVASKRKSRRHGDILSVVDGGGIRHSDIRSGGEGSIGSIGSPDSSLQKLPASELSLTAGESTSSLVGQSHVGRTSNLRPPSPGSSTRRMSTGAPSSYAGSLYDMYIEGDRASVDVSAFHYDTLDAARSLPPGSPVIRPQRNHIEVTERADGSIVWQIVAGLGRKERGTSGDEIRMSRYTGYSGHSRIGSQSSQASFLPRGSMEGSPNTHASTAPIFAGETTFSGLPANRDEDSRSLFARKRGDTKPSSYQSTAADLPPVPLLPPFRGLRNKEAMASSENDQEVVDAGDAATGTLAIPPNSVYRREEFSFDVATPSAGVTRVVYSNDVELEQLLESMARQNDAAKFHFDPRTERRTNGQSPGTRQLKLRSSIVSTGGDKGRESSGSLTDLPEDAARKVEEEIMNILASSSTLQQPQAEQTYETQDDTTQYQEQDSTILPLDIQPNPTSDQPGPFPRDELLPPPSPQKEVTLEDVQLTMANPPASLV